MVYTILSTDKGNQMLGYYPNVLAAVLELQSVMDTEGHEFTHQYTAKDDVLEDAYFTTMNEERIEQWEKALGITPLATSTLDNRRSTIMARIRGNGKLNTATIDNIVNAFTGGKANSWVANSTLYVEVTPPPHNKQFQFADVENELKMRVPAHLNFQVSRNYFEWGDIKDNFDTWGDVNTECETWEDVYLFVPFSA